MHYASYRCGHQLISVAWWLWPRLHLSWPPMCVWKTKLSLPMSPLHRQKDCSSGNAGQEVRGGSQPFVLNTPSSRDCRVNRELGSISSLNADPSLSCFVAIFCDFAFTETSSFFFFFFFSYFAANWQQRSHRLTFPTWCLFWTPVMNVMLWRVKAIQMSQG